MLLYLFFCILNEISALKNILCFFAVPPCRHKCCKVRFKTTIEVRERQGSDCQQRASLLHGATQRNGEDGPIKPLSIWKVMGVAFIFGILVRRGKCDLVKCHQECACICKGIVVGKGRQGCGCI
jgi:hypothetical protein